jgi:hypothetical protein
MKGGAISFLFSEDPFTRKTFDGFWFPDTPEDSILTKIPALIILNTDESTGPGEHWCAAFISKSRHCEYFDPLGAPPNNELLDYFFIPHLSKFAENIEFNTVPVQHIEAKTCGPHCIYFGYFRSRGFPLQTIINNFYSTNLQANDALVSDFIFKLNKSVKIEE